jgi:trimeric autotransporter adhesin
VKIKSTKTRCLAIAIVAFVISGYFGYFAVNSDAQVTTRWDLLRVLRAGNKASKDIDMNGYDILGVGTIFASSSVYATDTVSAVNNITSTAGNLVATVGDVSAGDDLIAGDDVRLSQGGMVILNSATDTATVSYNGTSINLSLGTTVAGNIESTSGDVIAFDDLIAGGDVVATGTVSAASASFSGIATATQFVSTIAGGTPPLAVTSNTLVSNLNADLLDGNEASAFATAAHVHTLQAVTDAGSTTTNAITAGGFSTAGNATAAYFIGNGSLLTDLPASGDFKADGSVPMTGAYTSGVYGTNGYDFTQNGYYSAAFYGKMFWDSSKVAFRAGGIAGGAEWDDGNVGLYSIGLGFRSKASAQDTMAFGPLTIASQQYATAIGASVTSSGATSFTLGRYITASGDTSMVIGRGAGDASRLTNNIANSLMVGFNSTVPTLFVSKGSGGATYGQVGIGTTSPLAGSLIDVEGVLNSASITSEGTIFATGTISSVAGYIANGNPGIDYTPTVCCTWEDDFTCSATGTVTFTKGILTAETCP